jgi:hypothetical protein
MTVLTITHCFRLTSLPIKQSVLLCQLPLRHANNQQACLPNTLLALEPNGDPLSWSVVGVGLTESVPR